MRRDRVLGTLAAAAMVAGASAAAAKVAHYRPHTLAYMRANCPLMVYGHPGSGESPNVPGLRMRFTDGPVSPSIEFRWHTSSKVAFCGLLGVRFDSTHFVPTPDHLTSKGGDYLSSPPNRVQLLYVYAKPK